MGGQSVLRRFIPGYAAYSVPLCGRMLVELISRGHSSPTGNEEDHIILSVVRSDKVGFLSNRRRSNVMLSRCKVGMYVCTSRAYLSNIASSTLLGEMAEQWGPGSWHSWQQIVAGK